MRLQCQRKELLAAVQLAAAVPARDHKPVLRNLKATVAPERCSLLATDLELGLRLDVSGLSVEEPGEVLLPAKRMLDILRETSDESLALETTEQACFVRGLKTAADLRVPRRKAVVRTNTRAVLGVVSRGYTPIQNRQCFNFLDSLVADAGVRYHTCGALGKGERIWLLAKLPSHIRVRGSDDEVQKFLLLSNSHDGSSALRCLFTGIRGVCANTLNAALRHGAGEGIAIRHRGNLAAKVQEARDALGLAQRFFDDLEGQIDRLAMHTPTQAQLAGYFKVLFPDPEERRATRAENVRTRLTELFESGMGQDIPQVRHTSWAAFNAVSEYVDHHKPTRGRDDADRGSKRLESSLFGTGANLKAKAFDLALKMADGEILADMAA